MLQACVTKLSVTFLLVHCVCDVAAGRIVRAAEDSGHVTESPGPAVTSVTEAPCVTLPCHVSRELSAGLVTERPGGCVTRYTAVSRVVHDTVLRRQVGRCLEELQTKVRENCTITAPTIVLGLELKVPTSIFTSKTLCYAMQGMRIL